jgi:predicted lipid-binding transport protein (Tim44 family)
MSRWLSVTAAVLGLVVALGGMLGAFLAGRPALGALFGALLAGIVAFAGLAAFLRRRRAGRAGATPSAAWQYAGLGSETVAAPPPSQAVEMDPHDQERAARAHFPAGFDVAGFLRAAKDKFVRLQMAKLRGRLDELREVTTTDMFETLRGVAGAAPHTDVVTLDAHLLEVATEAGRHRASVRFSGLVRATPGAEAASFEQVWNLVKPADSANEWRLAGIQRMH